MTHAAGAPIVHITTAAEWAAAQRDGAYRAPSLDTDGFIHLSRADQVVRVADAAFRGREDLVLLAVDPERLSAPVRWEPAEDGETFPHVYGPIEVAAVVAVVAFPEGPSGFSLPQAISRNESPSRTREPGPTGARSTRTSST